MTETRINGIVMSGLAAARPVSLSLATPASGPNPSGIYCATDTGAITMWDFAGSAWVAAGGGSGTVTSVSLSAPLGGGTVTTSGTLGTSSFTAHGVLIGAGTSAVAVTAAGTAGQVLTSNGASADPTFQTLFGLPLAAPTMRGTTAHTTTGSSQAMALPGGTAAGDLAVLFSAGGNAPSSFTGITGWTTYLTSTGGYWNIQIYTKTLTSGDISTGSVTVNFSAFQQDLFLTTFVGVPTIYSLGLNAQLWTGGTPANTQTISLVANGPWTTNGLHLIYISGRINATQSTDVGSIIGSALTATNGSASLYQNTFGNAVPLANNNHGGDTAAGISDVMIGFIGP